ncbi:hypothetical protein VP01_26g1 [Puccinia sorghi]|uniref:Myb/SANT-like domain-containing protein n=1 Tax=Puccinia sorghi TaxID=27349 RepID=A0A0L6V3R9_9BASI|nr:hypothetical protein VP01_26g1 [Puccinia sorghi]
MNKQYGANFDCGWLKDQFDHLRNTYIDIESLRDLPGFDWRKKRIQANPATWKRLLQVSTFLSDRLLPDRGTCC